MFVRLKIISDTSEASEVLHNTNQLKLRKKKKEEKKWRREVKRGKLEKGGSLTEDSGDLDPNPGFSPRLHDFEQVPSLGT